MMFNVCYLCHDRSDLYTASLHSLDLVRLALSGKCDRSLNDANRVSGAYGEYYRSYTRNVGEPRYVPMMGVQYPGWLRSIFRVVPLCFCKAAK